MGYSDEKVEVVDTQITELLRRVREGDPEASQELMPLVYAQLRSIAGKYLRKERKDHTLQPTALVNEVYIRMFGSATPNVADKAHFLAIASQMMLSGIHGQLEKSTMPKRVSFETGTRPLSNMRRGVFR
jgi:hypothetical protein